MKEIRFIDLFAGIGGIRKGFELAAASLGYKTKCVYTSEIKPAALKVLRQNHPEDKIAGDITKVKEKDIKDFDFLLAGFPCQAFSSAGKRQGFLDTRGTLFFDVARILKAKKPFGFVLENVEGLVNHDMQPEYKNTGMGKTLNIILRTLNELGYKVSWKVLDACHYGVPQRRKRIYIVGSLDSKPNLDGFAKTESKLKDILEHGLETVDTPFVRKLLSLYPLNELPGKAIKDKRGGDNNIHSWDLELKGPITQRQKDLLNQIVTKRRSHSWADEYGIDWMDGMPLTIQMIRTFSDYPKLEDDLNDLVRKRYLKYEHPKKLIKNEKGASVRVYDESLPKGYNIVAGKKSFEINCILDPEAVSPTLVAMDMDGLFVVDGPGIRPLSLREGLRLFGYPNDFRFDVSIDEGRDLLGNTVVVPVIQLVSTALLNIYRGCKK